MSNQDKPPIHPKVVSLASRGIQPRFSDLVQACRKLVMNRLAEHLSGVFGQVDDTLFECAEKAENNPENPEQRNHDGDDGPADHHAVELGEQVGASGHANRRPERHDADIGAVGVAPDFAV